MIGTILLDAEGHVVGDVVSATIDASTGTIRGYASHGARLFDRVRIDGFSLRAPPRAAGASTLVLSGDAADITIADDARATLALDAKERTDAAFDLARGVSAQPLSRNVARLDGVAFLVLRSARADARLDVTPGRVDAALEPGDRLLVVGAPDAFASDAVLAQAIADGRVALTALVRDARATVEPQARDAYGEVAAVAPGQVAFDVEGSVLVVDAAPGSSLPAKGAGDLRALVDGAFAPLARSAEAALASGGPAYFPEIAPDGAVRVIVRAADGPARVVVLSALGKAPARDAFGALRLFDGGAGVGDLVAFAADVDHGAIRRLAVAGETVFASVDADGSPFRAIGRDGPATLRFEGDAARILVEDATTTPLQVVATRETDATLQLADGLHAVGRAPGVLRLVDATGKDAGDLAAGPGATLSSNAAGAIHAHLAPGARIVYRANAGLDRAFSEAHRAMVARAIADGRLAGQVVVRAAREGALELASGVTPPALVDAYGDVLMETTATRERVDVTLSSTTSAGRTILVTLDPATVPGFAAGDAQILLDGAPVGEAASLADVLDPTDDAGRAEALVLAGERGAQALVSIPHFSVHTLTIQEKPDTTTWPASTSIAVLLGLLAAAEVTVLARRRKRTQ